MESLPLPSFSPHNPTPYTTDLCPSYYLSLLQSKIQSRFNNNIFIQDLIKDMITEISDVTTQIDRLNRNTYDDLTKLGLIQQAKWLEQLRKTQSWLITFTSDKLLYITNKYLSIKQKELGKPQEKTYCSICNKQLREAKIQQISNSLHTTSHLTPYRNIKQESDEETPYNELDLLMLQVEKSKKQLLSLNNQKTIYSLQQFLHETNHTIQVFYQDRTNFQRMQDNRDIVAILFKEFITKFMEVSNSDIKPTVIKCAEDLAEFLFRRRKDGMEFREQETQTAPWAGGGLKTMKNLEKSKSNTKDAKEAALKKNQQLLLEHKSRIEALTKENTNLERQIKQLNTQKILSSMRMLEQDTVLQADNPPTIRPSETDTHDPSRKQPSPQNPPPPLKPDFQPMRLTDAFPSKRVTILRSSIKPNFKTTEVWRDSRGSAVSSGKRSYVSHVSKGSNVSGRSNSNASRSKKFVEMMEEGGGEEEEVVVGGGLEREEDVELEMEMEEEGEIQEKIECMECGVQVDIVTDEIAVQTDEIETTPTPREPQTPSEKSQKQQPQPQPPSTLPHRSSQLTSPSLKRQFQLTRTTTDWNLSSNLHKTQILESQQLSSSSSSSSLSTKILSPEELKSQSIKNELITMIAKMNLNTLKHMSNTYLKPAYGRKNKTAVGHKITIENNRSSLADTRGSFIVGKGLKPLTGISLNREDPLLKQQPLEIKGMDEPLEKDRRPQDRSKLSLRGFDPMNQTQNRFNKQRSSQKINGTFIEGKASIFNLSTPTTTTPNNTIQTRSKRQTEVISRFKTQTQTQTQTIRKNEISFDHPPQRTQTQLTPNPTRTFQDHFTPHDLIHFFGSLQSAFSYQSSTPTTKHKLETKFKKKHEIMISNLYTHLEEMKREKGELYHKIKGFVKFPYQSVVNQFEGPRMESSISAGVFGNLMCYLMNLHDGCERVERKVYCEHIARLLRKLEFTASGDKERNKDKEKQKINLPKLQQSPE